MTKEIINEVVSKFVIGVKEAYGAKLDSVILFGSCARGDYDVLVSPIIESKDSFYTYMDASGFFQNVQKEGVLIA